MEQTIRQKTQDPARLAALRATGLLDTPAEEAFDQLTRLAAQWLQAPVALVSLVDADRQFFKSCAGEPLVRRETPLVESFCQYAVASQEPLVVRDAREHPLVKNNPAVARGVIAYLGVPLITREGHALGTLCVFDAKPRDWSDEQLRKMQELAASVMDLIEERNTAH